MWLGCSCCWPSVQYTNLIGILAYGAANIACLYHLSPAFRSAATMSVRASTWTRLMRMVRSRRVLNHLSRLLVCLGMSRKEVRKNWSCLGLSTLPDSRLMRIQQRLRRQPV